MRLIRVVLAVLLVVVGSSSYAHIEDSVFDVKTSNPDVVYFYVFADIDCPVSSDEVQEIVEGELIRSRFSPKQYYEDGQGMRLTLDVVVDCLDIEVNTVYTADVQFVQYLFSDEGDIKYEIPIKEFGRFGIGKKDFILASLENMIEDAIIFYIKANYDLE